MQWKRMAAGRWGWMAGAGHLAWIQIQNEKEKKMDRGGREQVGEEITWWAMSTVTFLVCGHPQTQHCGH